ncbi:hypothetical protein NFI96_034291 [Prochilodus magdalenae]|nr:hypothetical protein NFI96_034291 [Prochilodus magdalenae]
MRQMISPVKLPLFSHSVLQASWGSTHAHIGLAASASFGSARQISPLCFTDSGFNSDSSPDIRRSASLRNRLVGFNLIRPAWVVAQTRLVVGFWAPASEFSLYPRRVRSLLVAAAVQGYTGSFYTCACAVYGDAGPCTSSPGCSFSPRSRGKKWGLEWQEFSRNEPKESPCPCAVRRNWQWNQLCARALDLKRQRKAAASLCNEKFSVILDLFVLQNPEMLTRKIKLWDINAHITCRLCEGYLIDATTVTECLHTFCRSCLVKYLEENNTCPTCRIVIHQSHPLQYIGHDRTMQDIVYKLVPGLQEAELKKQRDFYQKLGMEVPGDIKGELCNMKPHLDSQRNGEVKSEEGANKDGEEKPEEDNDYHRSDEQVSICLECNSSKLRGLKRKWIRCSAQATVLHLKKFIAKKLNLTSFNEVGPHSSLHNFSSLSGLLEFMAGFPSLPRSPSRSPFF